MRYMLGKKHVKMFKKNRTTLSSLHAICYVHTKFRVIFYGLCKKDKRNVAYLAFSTLKFVFLHTIKVHP
jgi:hypothetical protein